MITFDGPRLCHPLILRRLETEQTNQVIVAHQRGSFIASSKHSTVHRCLSWLSEDSIEYRNEGLELE